MRPLNAYEPGAMVEYNPDALVANAPAAVPVVDSSPVDVQAGLGTVGGGEHRVVPTAVSFVEFA